MINQINSHKSINSPNSTNSTKMRINQILCAMRRESLNDAQLDECDRYLAMLRDDLDLRMTTQLALFD